MSAPDRGTASDYSKGLWLRRADLLTARGLLATVAVAAAALLVIAELSPLYTVVVGSLGTPQRSVSGGEHHGYALALAALGAVVMAAGALRGARAAALSLVAIGAAVALVALAIDLPATRRSSSLPEAVAFADARAQAGSGLTLELAGGVGLVVAGLGLLALIRWRPSRLRI